MCKPKRTTSLTMPNNNNRTVIIMVGLPARGKSYITKKINNYLSWSGYSTKLFNVGNKRRTQAGVNENHRFDFFDPTNLSNVQCRDQLALESMNELLDFLHLEKGDLGIFDATNSTLERRDMLIQYIIRYSDSCGELFNVLFLESVCDDSDLIDKNVFLKLQGPDYKNCEDRDQALADFRKRLSNYERCYITMSSKEIQALGRKYPNQVNLSFIKIINIYELSSFNLNCKILRHLNKFLLNFNNYEKNIYITLDPSNVERFHEFDIREELHHLHVFSEAGFSEVSEDRHQLISDLEAIESNLIIVNDDFVKLNLILKYYNIQNFTFTEDSSSRDLIYCINTSHYNDKLTTFESKVQVCQCDSEWATNTDAIPTLSSSSLSSRSNSSNNITTPIDSFADLPKLSAKFNKIMEEFVNTEGELQS
ncbi:hypothetical protein WICPIJ_005793 [Wickerhamomyces pijperi]|uniref:6-phosphofructo-2-kinase domain-containing protein n=1 Tax=Wickerhamomyces pijperi TaxID=599730 RepID=A0A9P8Q4Z8_WICPI|nr:hypothetical protein WICPIJ_005793 [Wickerhamomyces pijperi]